LQNEDVGELEKIFTILAQELGDSASKKILDEDFGTTVRGGSNLTEQLKSFFLSETGRLDDSLKLITLLKTISVDMYFPAYLRLRNAFFSVFPFKDVKGSGRLAIIFSEPADVSKGAPVVEIIHTKKEQTTSEGASQYFEFDWELRLKVMDLEQKTLETSVQIVDYAFGDFTTDDIKIDATAAWSPFLAGSLKAKDPLTTMNGKKTLTGKSRKKILEAQKAQEKS